jgi:hypothetical protein
MTGVGNANSGDFSLPTTSPGDRDALERIRRDARSHVLGRASNYLPAEPIPRLFNRINDAHCWLERIIGRRPDQPAAGGAVCGVDCEFARQGVI